MDDPRPRQTSSEPCLGQFSSGLPGLDTFPQPNLPGTASVLGLHASGTSISLVSALFWYQHSSGVSEEDADPRGGWILER
jgi:hypothetical protein